MLQTITDEARYAMEVGREHHYRFRVVGTGGMIDEPVFKNGWWYCPESTTPPEALGRVNVLVQSGLKLQGFIVAHETSNALPAPKVAPSPKVSAQVKTAPQPTVSTLSSIDLETVVMVALKVAGFLMLMPLMLFGLALDPGVIIVLEDGTWLEVMYWFD